MEDFIRSIQQWWELYIQEPIKGFNPFWDTLDILILTVILYAVYLFMKGRRAWKLTAGIALVLVVYAVSGLGFVELDATHAILSGIAPYGIILLAVVFQPEIRDVLERLGSRPFGLFASKKGTSADLAHTVSEVVDAACQIAMSEKDGALIVIERSTPLGDYADKGHLLDAAVTSNLLRNIFVEDCATTSSFLDIKATAGVLNPSSSFTVLLAFTNSSTKRGIHPM